ncbi:uncharacterized protein LOC101854712 [Aplysia californica]|uniref:Uncharacterized protein LOC101854712 n=1 Tax=Aplysia californica TaxID=6500 RepID=A0ABM1VS63_APLCA|nr:uncharacterized protein LOC101854712 [Aplysia californica]XP_035825255.1 uncharacterized protein LOC101854712 [Aplysia californica]
MLELMSWGEIVENLRSEGNFKMAAVFDLNAEKIAESEGAVLTCEEAEMILKSLDHFSTMIYGLFLTGLKFSCISVDRDTILGQGDGNVFVGYRRGDLLVCAVSGLNSKSSCLGTVKNFVGRLVAKGVPELAVPCLSI